MVCDLCGGAGKGTWAKAADMSDAARKGFDPFSSGIRADPGLSLGGGSYFADSWRNDAVSGPTSKSEWNVCGQCMKRLTLYLG